MIPRLPLRENAYLPGRSVDVEGGLYFGYGALLGPKEMRRHCPTSTEDDVAGLANHRVEFWTYDKRGECVACHIVRSLGNTVYGLVYWVSCLDLGALDHFLGVEQGWFDRRPIEVVTLGGRPLEASTHFIATPVQPGVPSARYTNLIRTGLHNERLPESYVARRIADLVALQDSGA